MDNVYLVWSEPVYFAYPKCASSDHTMDTAYLLVWSEPVYFAYTECAKSEQTKDTQSFQSGLGLCIFCICNIFYLTMTYLIIDIQLLKENQREIKKKTLVILQVLKFYNEIMAQEKCSLDV